MENNISLDSYYFAKLPLTKDIVVFYSESEEAFDAASQVNFFNPSCNIHFIPDLNFLTEHHNNARNLSNLRNSILHKLSKDNKPKIIFTTISNLFCYLPSPSSFTENALNIKIGENIGISFLAEILVDSGFLRVSTIMASGEFAIRGEIIDIATIDNFYRVQLEWDKVKSIKIIDPVTQLSNDDADNIIVYPLDTMNEKFIEKAKIRLLQLIGHKARNHNVFKKLEQHNITAEIFYPLIKIFNDNTTNILSYVKSDALVFINKLYKANITQINDLLERQYQENRFLLPIEDVFFSDDQVIETLSKFNINHINKENSHNISYLTNKYYSNLDQSKWESILELFSIYKDKTIILCAKNDDNLEDIKSRLTTNNLSYKLLHNFSDARKGEIYLTLLSLNQGCLVGDDYLLISCKDFIASKNLSEKSKQSGFSKLQKILSELENLKPQDLVVHKKHGIGRFLQIETINIKDCQHDCLKISYENNDLLYVPVENIKLVKKYGTGEAALDKLGNHSWLKRKAVQKDKIGALAAELVKVAAARSLYLHEPIEVDNLLYEKFCQEFPYQLTQDQVNGIDDIRNDLASGKLMDRLVCGDVGFGKTEVIMHAVFFLTLGNISGKSQVVVLVPTMTLARQHYLNFVKRFKNFDVNIVQLSRLVSATELKASKIAIAENKADIIIGTHAALASSLQFVNLGLVVVDEEQHFGVNQKEKLKKIANNIHSLHVSATPIPRTLQISMAGVKDLSLISTPPLGRMPVKTIIDSYSNDLAYQALTLEMERGGQSFYVCPRIVHLEEAHLRLKKLLPTAKIQMLHGQMKPSEIEESLNDFYEGKYDILLSTNIVESGLDVAKANTIIIEKVEMLGLSQLYQLRGRVGRNNIQGYAYLFFDKDASFTKQATRRLEVMENIDYLGAGFAIASHDMDIRGFGNILGAEQAGHIKEIGVELYQEMLDEAINALRYENNKSSSDEDISINLALDVYIPENYVEDGNIRLALYKRIGGFTEANEVENFTNEMKDRFGVLPIPLINLLAILELKKDCKNLGITKIDAGDKGFSLKLAEDSILTDKLINFATKFPNKIKIKPDNKISIITDIAKDKILEKTKNLLVKLSEM